MGVAIATSDNDAKRVSAFLKIYFSVSSVFVFFFLLFPFLVTNLIFRVGLQIFKKENVRNKTMSQRRATVTLVARVLEGPDKGRRFDLVSQ